jgi:hypothetical protein
MKRPLPDGTTHLFFTGLEFLQIQTASNTAGPWTNIYSTTTGDGGTDDLTPVRRDRSRRGLHPHVTPHGMRKGGGDCPAASATDLFITGPYAAGSASVNGSGTTTRIAAASSGSSCDRWVSSITSKAPRSSW